MHHTRRSAAAARVKQTRSAAALARLGPDFRPAQALCCRDAGTSGGAHLAALAWGTPRRATRATSCGACDDPIKFGGEPVDLGADLRGALELGDGKGGEGCGHAE